MSLEPEVEQLRAENAALRQLLAEMRVQVAAAMVRIAELEAQLSQRSGPPPFVKPNRQKPKRAGEPRRKRAAEHKTSRKRMTATRVERHALEHCAECNYRLRGESLDYSRQVVELPPPQPVEVLEHQVVKRWCPHCERWRSPHLDLSGQVVGRNRFGVRITALVGYLRTALRLPVSKVQSYLFVRLPGVPADNNLAERSLRPLVIARKISGGTRSDEDTKTRLTLASLFGTWQARHLNPFLECLAALQHPAPAAPTAAG